MRSALTVLAGVSLASSCGHPALPPGGDFVLQAPEGPLDTRALRGKVLLLFFSYTHCPDVCPAHLREGAQAFNGLTAEERARVRMILVTVDPWRDTPAKLKDYAAFVSPAFTGVTGTPEEIARVARTFDATFFKQEARPDGTYDVGHTERIYLVGPDGKLAAVLGRGATAPGILKTLRKLL
jgi:protein SCO1/2